MMISLCRGIKKKKLYSRNLEEIGAMAFKGLTNLKEIIIQNCHNLRSIDPHAFYQNVDEGIG